MKKLYFYNLTFNIVSPDGKQKFIWGINEFDISETLLSQCETIIKNNFSEDIFNINLTSFQPLEKLEPFED